VIFVLYALMTSPDLAKEQLWHRDFTLSLLQQMIVFGTATVVIITMVHPVSFATTFYAGGNYFDISHWMVWFQKDMWTSDVKEQLKTKIWEVIYKKFAFWDLPMFGGSTEQGEPEPDMKSAEGKAAFAIQVSNVITILKLLVKLILVPLVKTLLKNIVCADKQRFSLITLFALKKVEDVLDEITVPLRKDLTLHVSLRNHSQYKNLELDTTPTMPDGGLEHNPDGLPTTETGNEVHAAGLGLDMDPHFIVKYVSAGGQANGKIRTGFKLVGVDGKTLAEAKIGTVSQLQEYLKQRNGNSHLHFDTNPRTTHVSITSIAAFDETTWSSLKHPEDTREPVKFDKLVASLS